MLTRQHSPINMCIKCLPISNHNGSLLLHFPWATYLSNTLCTIMQLNRELCDSIKCLNKSFLNSCNCYFVKFSRMTFTTISNLYILVIYLEMIAISYLHHACFLHRFEWIMLCYFGFCYVFITNYIINLIYYIYNKLITLTS